MRENTATTLFPRILYLITLPDRFHSVKKK